MYPRAEPMATRWRLDWVLVGVVVSLVILGTLAILSAASPMPHYTQILQRHFTAIAVGSLAFAFGAGFNYQIFQDQSRTLYALVIAILICVLVFGSTVRGQKSWLQFPYFSFQPSEFARIGTILIVANYIDRRAVKLQGLWVFIGAFAVAAPILGLILAQPDFSGTAIFFPMILAMLFCAGAKPTHLAAISGFGLITLGLPFLWTLGDLHPRIVNQSKALSFFMSMTGFNIHLLAAVIGIAVLILVVWRLLETLRVHLSWIDYAMSLLIVLAGLCSAVVINGHIKWHQRRRFMAFLAPDIDPQGASYNVTQALVAIGSGGVFGKGIFSGTQSQLGFLPERHTDFIFAVIGEEIGFIGSVSLLVLYMILLWRVVEAARVARDRYGFLVCTGILAMMASYLLMNVGMCVGVLPVAGVPLPLVSYGGSSLVITLWALGVVANIHSKRYSFV